MPDTTQPTPAPSAPATPPDKPAPDAFLASVLATFGNTMAEGKIEPLRELPREAAPHIVHSSPSLGEMIGDISKTPEPPAAPAPAVPPAAAPVPAEPPKPPPVKPSRVDELAAKIAAMNQPVPPAPILTPPITPPDPAKPDDDAAFIATLDADQKEELEFAAWAESKHPEQKGKRAETLAFYRKLEDYIAKNPNELEGEEFDTFIAENKPKYSDAQRRRLDREMIEDRAAARTRKEMKEELDEVRFEQHRIRVEPVIRRQSAEFAESLVSPKELPKDSTGLTPFPRELADALATGGYQAAAQQFPVEAPVFQSAIHMTNEFLALAHGLKETNLSNPMHAKLVQFVEGQAAAFKKSPGATRGGKTFLSRGEFAQAVSKDPDAAAKHFTFEDAEIVDMIGLEALRTANRKLKELEAAGFRRETKTTKPENPPNPTEPAGAAPNTTPNPPRAGAVISPGGATTTGNSAPNATWINALFPGALNAAGQK